MILYIFYYVFWTNCKGRILRICKIQLKCLVSLAAQIISSKCSAFQRWHSVFGVQVCIKQQHSDPGDEISLCSGSWWPPLEDHSLTCLRLASMKESWRLTVMAHSPSLAENPGRRAHRYRSHRWRGVFRRAEWINGDAMTLTRRERNDHKTERGWGRDLKASTSGLRRVRRQ